MKTIIRLFCLIFLTASCSSDNETIVDHPNLGDYDLHSFTSNVAMDLDYDGIESTDFKAELDWLYFNNRLLNTSLPMVIRNAHHHNYDDIEVLVANNMGMPRDDYHPLSPHINVRFKGDDRVKLLEIKENEVLNIFYPDSSPDHEINLPDVNSFVLNDNNTVTVDMSQRFFDLLEDEWKQVELVAVYKKIEDSND
jgi:hypothetical protein